MKGLGVRFGAFSLYLPALLTPEARGVGAVFAELAAAGLAAGPRSLDGLAAAPAAAPRRSLCAVCAPIAGLAAPVEALERLDALIRAAPQEGGAWQLPAEVWTGLGWEPGPAERILRALGFVLVRKAGRRGTRPLASPRASGARPRRRFRPLFRGRPPARRRRRPRLAPERGLVRNPA